MCLPNHIGRLLALTSNETCDNSCHTGGSHAIVAGVWYSLFESLRRRTIWLKFPDDLQWIQTSLSTQLSRRNAHKTDFCVRLKIHLLIHVKKGFDVVFKYADSLRWCSDEQSHMQSCVVHFSILEFNQCNSKRMHFPLMRSPSYVIRFTLFTARRQSPIIELGGRTLTLNVLLFLDVLTR